MEDDLHRLRERENSRITNKQTKDETQQYTEVFRIDEYLSRIMPAADTNFKDASSFTEKVLQNIAQELKIVQGMFFLLKKTDDEDDEGTFLPIGQYAYFSEKQPRGFKLGESLSGQVAKNRQALNLKDLPEGYVTIISGLGKSAPRNLIIAPVVLEDNCIGVIEVASFKTFDENEEKLINRICESMANRLNELRN